MSRADGRKVRRARGASTPRTLGVDRIAAAFSRCFAARESALVTYVMAGDPDVATSKAMALACVDGGADLLELGIPFSDPIADGPTIQKAAERALASGTKLADVLDVGVGPDLFGDVFERVRSDYVDATNDSELVEAAIDRGGVRSGVDHHGRTAAGVEHRGVALADVHESDVQLGPQAGGGEQGQNESEQRFFHVSIVSYRPVPPARASARRGLSGKSCKR